MSTETRVEIDQQTKDELQPPCIARVHPDFHPCPRPSQWLVRLTCEQDRSRFVYYCDDHVGKAVAGRLLCTPCEASHYVRVLSVEPLR